VRCARKTRNFPSLFLSPAIWAGLFIFPNLLLPFRLAFLNLASVTPVIGLPGLPLTRRNGLLKLPTGGCMKDIHEVLRQKQARYAQLGKQIEMLQQAAEKLREVAPLLAESDEEDNAVLAEVEDGSAQPEAMSAKAGANSGSTASGKSRPTAPRWP
jgi:hypothetical protein